MQRHYRPMTPADAADADALGWEALDRLANVIRDRLKERASDPAIGETLRDVALQAALLGLLHRSDFAA